MNTSGILEAMRELKRWEERASSLGNRLHEIQERMKEARKSSGLYFGGRGTLMQVIPDTITALEASTEELRSSLADALRQVSYYRALVSSMKKSVSPSQLKRLIRSL